MEHTNFSADTSLNIDDIALEWWPASINWLRYFFCKKSIRATWSHRAEYRHPLIHNNSIETNNFISWKSYFCMNCLKFIDGVSVHPGHQIEIEWIRWFRTVVEANKFYPIVNDSFVRSVGIRMNRRIFSESSLKFGTTNYVL